MLWHNEDNKRFFPWKNEKNPYKIWLSEIMLQQTKSEQALPYYTKFTNNFPSITDLANAPDELVFKLWEGLGYYSRCKNMLATARLITEKYKGVFPKNYEDIIQLKGVGKYTAAAISSFAYNLPYAVLDGNVFRVLSRYLASDLPIDTKEGIAYFNKISQEFLDKKQPALYNQAIMDFGATICTPKNPQCNTCVLQKDCLSYKQNIVHLLPLKAKSLKVKTRHFHYLILKHEDKIYIRQRKEKDIWQNLFEFYLIENNNDTLHAKELIALKTFIHSKPKLILQSKQRLTHRIIETKFYEITLKSIPIALQNDMWVRPLELVNFAFPRTIISFLKFYNYF